MENSRYLLQYAVDCLHEANITKDQWVIGGGTVLAEIYHHRLSKDIDVFLEDIQLLSSLSPRFNGNSDMALDYNEMTNYISLTFKEGKVDFIVSPQITDFHPVEKEFHGRTVKMEDAVEIVSKKMYFRGDNVLSRDIFDLAIVYNSERKFDLIHTSLKNLKKQFDSFGENFYKKMQNKDFELYSVGNSMMLLENGREFIGKDVRICADFIETAKSIEQVLCCSTNISKVSRGCAPKEIFTVYAKSVIAEEENNKWNANTNQKIVSKLHNKGFAERKIYEIMSYSPIKEQNLKKVIRSLECGIY